MQGNDYFAKLAHVALQNHDILPSDYMRLSVEDRAFMAASDEIAAEKRREGLNAK